MSEFCSLYLDRGVDIPVLKSLSEIVTSFISLA